jgi:uncharacterized sulfatase
MTTLFLAAIHSGLKAQNIVKTNILFYDVRHDPEELVNRYNDPMYAAIIADLKEEILRQRKQLNETDEKYPVINEIIARNWDKK